MLTHYRVLLHQGGITFGNSVIGFAIGALFGLALAVVMSLSKAVQHTLSPCMIASQMVPIIGLAPIVYGIVHDASVSRVLISAYVTFPCYDPYAERAQKRSRKSARAHEVVWCVCLDDLLQIEADSCPAWTVLRSENFRSTGHYGCDCC